MPTLLSQPRTASVTLEATEPTPPYPDAVVTYSVEAGSDGRPERRFLREAVEDLIDVGRLRSTLTAWTTLTDNGRHTAALRCSWDGESWTAWRAA